MDDVAFFDQMLTPAEVSGLFQGSLTPASYLPVPVTPEPSTFVLLSAVLTLAAGIAFARKRRLSVAG